MFFSTALVLHSPEATQRDLVLSSASVSVEVSETYAVTTVSCITCSAIIGLLEIHVICNSS
jgi:hypothetical protein